MKINELASCYLSIYDDTDVIITSINECDECNCIAFDTSDGKHFFSDDNLTCEVEKSLCDGGFVFTDTDGYLFVPDGSDPELIDWLDEVR